MFRSSWFIPYLLFSVILGACISSQKKEQPSIKPEELQRLVEELVVFGFPLLVMDASREAMTNPESPRYEGVPLNHFNHQRAFPDAKTKDVIIPSTDVLYSTAWLDLSKGPLILSLPPMNGRYYMMPMVDAWTNVFASVGTRTTGSKRGSFAIIGPDWQGQLPVEVEQIRAPTNIVWIIGRTHSKGAKDYAEVHALQDQYQLIPLSQFDPKQIALPKESTEPFPSVDLLWSPQEFQQVPRELVTKMDAQRFFNSLGKLIQKNPVALEDRVMLEKLARIGVTPGSTRSFSQWPLPLQQVTESALRAGFERVESLVGKGEIRLKDGWIYGTDMGSLANTYEVRAAQAWDWLGTDLTEDAIYPIAQTDVAGSPLTGKRKYVLHFTRDQIPPVNALWSLTLYDGKQGFVENPLNRYSVGSADHLVFNEDDSLSIYIQTEHPGKDKEANWLPAPRGQFNLILRLYWPKETVLSGEWEVPGVRRLRPQPNVIEKAAKRISQR